jgi:hypothetical protein
MAEWTKEEVTPEIRRLRYRVATGPNPLDVAVREQLQQKWRVTKGGTGKVEYSEEWRPLPVVEGEQ